MQQVFFDDYQELVVGPFPHDYSALGEYHFQLPAGNTGKWTATTVHHSWRGNPTWLINTEAGKKVMELACVCRKAIAMIVAGEAVWDNIKLKTSLRPLSLTGEFGVLFRYQTSRQYYALWYQNSKLQLRVCNDVSEVIAELPVVLGVDQYYSVEITVIGNQIDATVDKYHLSGTDNRFNRGKIGFAGTNPARFGKIEVLMDQNQLHKCQKTLACSKKREEEKRHAFPQPKLWKKIPTPGFGAGKSIRFGDLNNDGNKEIVLAQNVRRIRGDSFSEISCLTAIDLDGNVLWQIGEPNTNNALVTNDLPVQIHDIDGDGNQEVIFCKDFRINVIDGVSGKLKYQAPTPYAPAHKGNTMVETHYERITGDSLFFCDLSNRGVDRDLILKDRYNNIWAYTWDLQPIWHYQGNCGHYPMAGDVDGDGRDEILIGYTLLDDDGTVLWTHDIGDHADGVAVGKFKQDNEWQFIIAASDCGMYWLDGKGKIVNHHDIGHCQTATIASLIPGNSHLQVATVTFWGNPGIILVFDINGSLLKRREVIAPWGTALSPVNWNGLGSELILLSGHPQLGGMIDFEYDRVVSFPDDGHPYLCCEPLDLIGDARDEILLWDPDSLWIYTQDRVSTQQPYSPVRQPDYNMSNYRAQISVVRKGISRR